MSVDLTLFPLDFLKEETVNGVTRVFGYSHTILNVPTDYKCWDAIAKAPTRVLPPGVTGHTAKAVPDGSCEGESMYGEFTKDAYDEPYQLIKAKALTPILKRYFPTHPSTKYVEALAPENEIILGWH